MVTLPADVYVAASVNFVDNVLMLVAQALTIPLMGHLLWLAHASRRYTVAVAAVNEPGHRPIGTTYQRGIAISPSMTVYLVGNTLCALLSLPQYLYLVVNWRPGQRPSELYSPAWLYFTGLPNSGYYSVMPLFVFFLIVDRCLAVVLSSRMHVYRVVQKWMAVLSLIFILAVLVTWETITLVSDWPLVETFRSASGTECVHLACVSRYRIIYMLESKCLFEVGNLVASAVLFVLLRKSGSKSVVRERVQFYPQALQIHEFQKTRLVKLTLTLEVLLSTIPAFAVWLFSLLVGRPIADYIGPVGYVATMLDVCCCAFCYHWILYTRYRRKVVANAVAAAHMVPEAQNVIIREGLAPPPSVLSPRQRPPEELDHSSGGGIMYGGSSTPAQSFGHR